MSGPLKLCGVAVVLCVVGVALIRPLGDWALAFTGAGLLCSATAVVWSLIGGMKSTRAAMFDTPEDEEEWERDHDGDW